MWRRLLADGPIAGQHSGWAAASLVTSMRGAALLGMAVWQIPMVVTVAAQPGPVTELGALLLGHLLLLAAAAAAAGRRVPAGLVIAGCHLLFVVDWALVDAVDDPLLLAACWMMNLGDALLCIVLRGRSALAAVLSAVVVVPLAMTLARPGFDGILPLSVAVTASCIIVAFRIGLSYVADLAGVADAEQAAATRERIAVEVRGSASRRSAEDARILHDTVINTLGALANGAAHTAGPEAVRERCLRDVATIEALTHTEELRSLGAARSLHDGLAGAGITVRHSGIDCGELAHYEASVPAPVIDALARAVGELVRNAAKHAGVEEVVLHVEVTAEELVIVVRDEGVGFEPRSPAGRGLAESVFGRLADTGVRVELDTAPGRGTRVTLRYRWERTTTPEPRRAEPSLDRVFGAVQRRATGLFAGGMVLIGVVLAFTNHQGRATEEYPMVAVVALVCAVIWWCPPRWARWTAVSSIAGAAAAFVLSAAAVDFGGEEVVSWQAICPVGPLLLLLSARVARPWMIAGLTVYAATMLGLVVAIGPDPRALSVVVAGLAGIGLVIGWWGFDGTMNRVGRQAAWEQRSTAALRAQNAVREAALAARRRWSAAGLSDALDLLRQVASGVDPGAEDLRRACADEEAYLRQLTLLHPDLVRMGPWFARALAQARSSGVGLTVRSGATDVDERVAEGLGELMLAAVLAAPPGSRVTTTLFPWQRGARFTIVGPHPHIASVVGEGGMTDRPPTVRTFGAQDVIEIDIDCPPQHSDVGGDRAAAS